MTLKIRHKILLAIMATALLSVLALQLVQTRNFEQGLLRYSESNLLERLEPLSDLLAARYAQNGNWDFIRGRRDFSLGRGGMARPRQDNQNDNLALQALRLGREIESSPAISSLSILDANQEWLAGARNNRRSATKPIMLEEQIIGYLALAPQGRYTQQIDELFAEQQNNNRLWVSLTILFGALLSAFLMSRNLGKPIKLLNEQVQSLSDGKYDIHLHDERGDELGSLAKNFNRLADTLRSNRSQRQQWISDISHELRTPVSVLRAEMECIEDGLQPLDLDSIGNLKSQVERINLLIDDLHQLSQADSGAMTFDFVETDIREEIDTAVQSYREQFKRNKISVETDLENLPLVSCDPNRIRQVINNLLQNTLRYTDSPGQLKISAQAMTSNSKLSIVFADSSPGVPEESVERLFDRLYRVDPSRSRKTGSSGLGLSICAAIIKAHGGKITASRSALGGLAIYIELPITQASVS